MAALRNEARMLNLMGGTGFVPVSCGIGPDYTIQEDLGESQPVTDGPLFLRECVRLLATIRSRGLWHGDLTNRNIIIRDNRPYAIDWQESIVLGDPGPSKRPFSDGYHLWAAAAALLPEDRVSQRWLTILLDNADGTPDVLAGKSLADVGCDDGFFCGAAAAEGMKAVGWDHNMEAIQRARGLWHPGPRFAHCDILGPLLRHHRQDVALMLSVWPYLVKQCGAERAEAFLHGLIRRSGVLYFETQLAGDGPGPDDLRTDEDVAQLLRRHGNLRSLSTFPVAGRNASRTLWRVTA